MKKRNNLLKFLLISLLAFCVLFVAACQPPEEETPSPDDEEETETSSLLITNGTFFSGTNSGSASTYLKDTVNGWTKTNAASYYSNATMGVVDLDQEKFNANVKSLYESGLTYPEIAPNTPKVDGAFTDTNALFIGLPETKGSVYYKTTSAITLKKNKYYKLSIDVYTDLIGVENDLQGAYLIINGSAFAEFNAIQTNKDWQTYEVYIEANNFEDRTFYVELWLGHGPRYIGKQTEEFTNPRITKGFALFDNVILTEENDATSYNAQKTALGGEKTVKYTAATATNNVYGRAVLSLDYPDKGFTYETKYSFISPSSTTSVSYYGTRSGAANNYTMTVGTANATTSSEFPSYDGSSATAGIFDMSQFYKITWTGEGAEKTVSATEDLFKTINKSFNAPAYADFYTDGVFGLKGSRSAEVLNETEALLIYHPDYAVSGLGYKSNKSYLIQKDKYYKISVWVYVWVPEYGVSQPATVSEPTIGPRKDESQKPNPADYAGGEANGDYISALAAYNANVNAWNDYDTKLAKYNEDLEKWNADKAAYNAAAARASAKFKLTGVSVEEDFPAEESAPGQTGQWEQLTFNVKGNELSDRNVFLEFWYGEGEWGSDTLMAGGAIFDNISIEVAEQAEAGIDYQTLSPLTADDFNLFDLLGAGDPYVAIHDVVEGEEVNVTSGPWDFSYEDTKSAFDNASAGIVQGETARTEALWNGLFPTLPMPRTLTYNDDPFNLIMLYNKVYTASKLTYDLNDGERQYIEINPNKFYRLSMWIRTDGIDEKLGLTVTLYDETPTSLSSLSAINTAGEWQEITFFVRGSSIKKNNAYIEFKLGSGDVYTPANHVKGVMYATAITYKTISYTEFNTASAGTYVAKKTISDTPSTSNTITNGYFIDLNTSNFESTEEIFDENGKLIGVAVPASWTVSSPLSALTAPSGLKIEDGKLKWTAVERAEKYYVYMDGIKVPDPKDAAKEITKSNVLIAIVDTNEYQISVFRTGSFKVRAYRSAPDADGAVGISAYSSTLTNTLTSGSKDYDESLVDMKNYFGVIDYKNYKDFLAKSGEPADSFYRTGADGLQYISTKSDYLLMLSSDYYTRGGYTSSSTNLSANSYYMLSVWVKTVGDAEASVTINNTSKVFARKEYEGEDYATAGDFVGYTGINTDGAWKQYRFYFKTTVSSASLQLELFLGNKYAVSKKIYGEDNKLKETINNGLSKGTVFFDDVTFVTVSTEEEFNKLAYGGDPAELEPEDIRKENIFSPLNTLEGSYFVNNYKFKILDYTTDSFDLFTESTTLNGGSPKDYTHYISTAGVDFDSSLEEQSMLYGVYDKRKVTADSELVKAITDSTKLNADKWMGDEISEEQILSFLTDNVGTGNNYLLMANLAANGQYYLSSSGVSMNSAAYYKITFYAKTLIPAGKYGEFRFEYGNETGKYSTIRVTNEGKGEGMQEYSFYVYNSSTASVSSNKISFYLGSNSQTASDATPTNFFKGLMIIDAVSVVKLDDSAEYDAAIAQFETLSADEKLNASFNTYKFVEKEKPSDGEEPPAEEETPKQINPQLWLIISSVVIGAILLAVIIILTWRKLKKKIKKSSPVKVESNVPVNLESKEQRRQQSAAKKKEMKGDEDFND